MKPLIIHIKYLNEYLKKPLQCQNEYLTMFGNTAVREIFRHDGWHSRCCRVKIKSPYAYGIWIKTLSHMRYLWDSTIATTGEQMAR